MTADWLEYGPIEQTSTPSALDFYGAERASEAQIQGLQQRTQFSSRIDQLDALARADHRRSGRCP